MKKKLLVALVPLILLSACGSVPKQGDSASLFGKGAKSGDTVAFPDWYYEKPNDDALYSVSSEYSKDLQFAVDKSMLSAKRELAGKYSSYVSAMMKDFTAEIGSGDDINRDIERTTKLLIAQVNLIGIKRVKFEVRHEGAGYRSFVQLRYSLDDSNRLLVEKIRADRKLDLALRKSAAFRELEDSVDKVNGVVKPEPRVENKPVEPATTDLTAKPVSMKAIVGETSSITKPLDETPVKVN
jgi:hypothetical protein